MNLPVANPAGQLALTLINLGSGNLINLELSALEADSRGKVVSSPRVITADNQKASIEQGTEIPYITPGSDQLAADGAVQEGGAARSTVTPQITPGQPHHHEVVIHKDTVGQVVRHPGQPSAVDRHEERDHADLREQRRHRGHRRHLRGDDPHRRRTRCRCWATSRCSATCSSTTGRSSEKTELLIFLTPRIVRESVTAVK